MSAEQAIAEALDDCTVNTAEVLSVLQRLDHTLAALRTAGVPEQELAAFKASVARGVNSKYRELAPAATAVAADVSSATADDEAATESPSKTVLEGVIDRLQRGEQGFSAIWRPRYVRVDRGCLKCYAHSSRPLACDTPAVTLPLTTQGTTMEICSEVSFACYLFAAIYTVLHLYKACAYRALTHSLIPTYVYCLHQVMAAKFERPCMFTVANTDRGGKLRSVTFGPANDVELVKWTEQIRKAYIADGQVCTPLDKQQTYVRSNADN
jgi:hypothetical protein